MFRSMKDLEQYEVCAIDGDVGKVADFLFDDASWRVRHLVVGTGGLLSRRQVLIPPSAFGNVDYGANRFRLTLSMTNVESSPTLEVDLPVSLQGERGPSTPPDAHLRSAREMAGYHIEATDGSIGHVRDLVVDDETWHIRYMVIATANWWPGKSVLVSPHWATRIAWLDRKVEVGMTRAAVRASPEWSTTYPVDADYAEELARHYQGIPGWRGRDRSLDPEAPRAPAGDEPSIDDGAVTRGNAWVAAHEERQIRAADDAVVRAAREGRLP